MLTFVSEMKDLELLAKYLLLPRNVVLLSHRNPDGDAIGSCLALSYFLQSKGHVSKVILPSEYPLAFEWMHQSNQILIYDLNPLDSEKAVEAADLIICLDFNSLDRIDKLGLKVLASSAPKIMIDHHLDPEPFADLVFSEVEMSSTCEIVYHLITGLNQSKLLQKEIIESLYTGIMTDTGSFHHNTSDRIFEILADFKRQGLNDSNIQELVLNSQPDKYLQLLGHCLHNRMELFPEQGFGLIYLTKDDYKNYDIRRGDTEGIINYLMMLKSIRVGALVMNQPSIVKLSMRSKAEFSVQKICRENFNGGGHRNASGGYSKLNLEDTLRKLKEVMGVLKTVNS